MLYRLVGIPRCLNAAKTRPDHIVLTVQNLLPMIFALVLLGVIQKGQHNPATWSGISNQIQATLWPFVLRGDGSSAKHVWWRVQFISGLGLFTTITLVLAGFLTPKPLTDNESFSRRAHNSKFSYAPGKELERLSSS